MFDAPLIVQRQSIEGVEAMLLAVRCVSECRGSVGGRAHLPANWMLRRVLSELRSPRLQQLLLIRGSDRFFAAARPCAASHIPFTLCRLNVVTWTGSLCPSSRS